MGIGELGTVSCATEGDLIRGHGIIVDTFVINCNYNGT